MIYKIYKMYNIYIYIYIYIIYYIYIHIHLDVKLKSTFLSKICAVCSKTRNLILKTHCIHYFIKFNKMNIV